MMRMSLTQWDSIHGSPPPSSSICTKPHCSRPAVGPHLWASDGCRRDRVRTYGPWALLGCLTGYKSMHSTLSDTTRKRKLLLKRLMGNDCKSVMCIFNTNTTRDEDVASPCSRVQARCRALHALLSLNHTTAFWTVVHLPGINLEVQRGKVTCAGSHSS